MIARFLCPTLAALLGAVSALAAGTPTITVDPQKVVVQPFMGLGVQWDPYEYRPSPAAWKLTLARLDYMRPAIVRVMWGASPYCLGFDEAGNPRYTWSESESVADERLQPLFAILDYAQSRNIDVMLGEWSPPRNLRAADGNAIAGPQDPRWARIIRDFVLYLTARKKYTVIRYYNYMNEPNGGWMWPGGKVDYGAWAAGLRNLRKEFDSNGLAWLPIAGPDNSGSWDWLDLDGEVEKLLSDKRGILLESDPNAALKRRFMGEVGLIEGKVNGDQQPRVKTFEYGVLMADFVAQIARAAWMGAIAWDLDDAMHVVNGRSRPVPPVDTTLKVWGFWNTQGANMGHPEDEAIRPWFYPWSLLTRLFPKGAAIVATDYDAGATGVRAVACTWKHASGSQLSIMVVNNGDIARTVNLVVPAAGRRPVVTYRYFANDRPVDKDGFPVPSATARGVDFAKGIKVELASRGVVFLTTANGE